MQMWDIAYFTYELTVCQFFVSKIKFYVLNNKY